MTGWISRFSFILLFARLFLLVLALFQFVEPGDQLVLVVISIDQPDNLGALAKHVVDSTLTTFAPTRLVEQLADAGRALVVRQAPSTQSRPVRQGDEAKWSATPCTPWPRHGRSLLACGRHAQPRPASHRHRREKMHDDGAVAPPHVARAPPPSSQ